MRQARHAFAVNLFDNVAFLHTRDGVVGGAVGHKLVDTHSLVGAGDEVERVRQAPRLRLVMTGWFQWSDASVNVAIARDPDWSFVPPILSVPDGEGGWTQAGPPLGFPAGKTKTMVVDVTDLVVRDDPRLRLSSTLELYWDSIHLAVCDDDGEHRVTRLEPASARLWRRGFSAPESELEGTTAWPWPLKKSRNAARSSALLICFDGARRVLMGRCLRPDRVRPGSVRC